MVAANCSQHSHQSIIKGSSRFTGESSLDLQKEIVRGGGSELVALIAVIGATPVNHFVQISVSSFKSVLTSRGELSSMGILDAHSFPRHSIASSARAPKQAPPTKVNLAPSNSHTNPARTLANSMAMPETRLKKPKAVPRNSIGAVSAIIVASVSVN